MHQLEHFGVENLNERSHVREMGIHRPSVRKIVPHSIHEVTEACVSYGLLVEDDQQRRHQVAHSLHVAYLQVFPYITVKST